jgi:thiamine biosynthesis lipoprotein
MHNIQRGTNTESTGAATLDRRQLLSFRGIGNSNERSVTAAGSWVTLSRRAMACNFRVIVDSGNWRAVRAATESLDEVDRLESILSIFQPSSEASRINREAAMGPVPVGPELIELLQLCKRLHEESEGAFDITTGALTECWGFQERSPRLPAVEILTSARRCVGAELISLGTDDSVSFSFPGVRINFGGVGKGYALDRGAAKIAAHGIEMALLSAGYSSVLALGAGPEGDGWHVGLRHPVYTGRRMASVRLHSCAMGTSGQEEQWFEESGKRYGHILDPQTGFPPTRVKSVSVITDSAARADALATAFFVAGPELAERYCSAHEGTVAVMLLEHDLSRPVVIGSCDRATVEVASD